MYVIVEIDENGYCVGAYGPYSSYPAAYSVRSTLSGDMSSYYIEYLQFI